MSLQNALTLIQVLRKENPEKLIDHKSLEKLADLSKFYNLECTVNELRSAFYTDWKMRWAIVTVDLTEKNKSLSKN